VSCEEDDTCMTKTLACQEKWAGGRRNEKGEGKFEFRV
jgi:hypothetical protein